MKRRFLLTLLVVSLIVLTSILACSCFGGFESSSNSGGAESTANQFATTPSQGLEYEENRDGYAVLSKGSCTDTKIFIPDTYNGKPVYGVFAQAFRDDKTITSVKFGKNVSFIGGSAFKGCTNLKYVNFNYGLEEIGEYCFENCPSLTNIDIPSSVVQVCHFSFDGEIHNGLYYIDDWCLRPDLKNPRSNYTLKPGTVGISDYAFMGASYSFSVETSTSLKQIGAWAFRNSALTEITLYNSLKSIDSNAFADCESLDEIFIPKSVTTIEENAFTVRSTKIYCESYSKPSGWASSWCPPYSANVYWGETR